LRAKLRDTARIRRDGAEAEKQNAKRGNGRRVPPGVTPKEELSVEAKQIGIVLVSGKKIFVIPFPEEFCIIPVTSEENKQAIA
tara:strand:- start:852 stop:1100 length:249 start_codon:yes stop_codon:yes gene_type:complete